MRNTWNPMHKVRCWDFFFFLSGICEENCIVTGAWNQSCTVPERLNLHKHWPATIDFRYITCPFLLISVAAFFQYVVSTAYLSYPVSLCLICGIKTNHPGITNGTFSVQGYTLPNHDILHTSQKNHQRNSFHQEYSQLFQAQWAAVWAGVSRLPLESGRASSGVAMSSLPRPMMPGASKAGYCMSAVGWRMLNSWCMVDLS